jgi:hypothetical protein
VRPCAKASVGEAAGEGDGAAEQDAAAVRVQPAERGPGPGEVFPAGESEGDGGRPEAGGFGLAEQAGEAELGGVAIARGRRRAADEHGVAVASEGALVHLKTVTHVQPDCLSSIFDSLRRLRQREGWLTQDLLEAAFLHGAMPPPRDL